LPTKASWDVAVDSILRAYARVLRDLERGVEAEAVEQRIAAILAKRVEREGPPRGAGPRGEIAMTGHLWLTDLINYSAQIAVIITLGSLAPRLLGLRRPDAMLIYRQALLAACLVLPLLQPWETPTIVSSGEVSVGVTTIVTAAAPARPLADAGAEHDFPAVGRRAGASRPAGAGLIRLGVTG